MSLKVLTWNVNSVRLRLDHLARVVERLAPDVVCLQETKVRNELFPDLEIAALGFPYREILGMKGYNGVAILSRHRLADPRPIVWCGREDCRHLAATLAEGPLAGTEVHSLYIPAGGDKPDPRVNDKFAHKLRFLEELAAWSAERRGPAVLAGDFNVAPLVTDVWDHEKLKRVVTHTEPEITRLDAILSAGGWVDSVRARIPAEEKVFTWWSYRAGGDWALHDRGRRLDHIWVSPEFERSVGNVTILDETRGWEKPSDHVPVMTEIFPSAH